MPSRAILKKFSPIAIAVGLLLGTACFGHSAHAETGETHRYEIPAGSLAEGIKRFGVQSHLQLLAPPELLQGLRGSQVSGEYSARQALDQLLIGTGLSYEFVNGTTVVIKRGEPKPAPPRREPPRKPAGAAQADSPKQLKTVEVVGSRLSAPSYERAQPVRIVKREEIERSGAGSIAQVLNNLPEVSIQSTTSPFQNSRGVSTVQLRGLPSGTALVLLNGRRLTGTPFQSSSGVINLNILPLAAVDRIEVLPSGSSAIYGGDALAGVVNIVLKKDFDGTEINARYGGAEGYDERAGSFAWGKTFSRGAISFVGSYADNNELQGLERSITANNDYRRFGGHDASGTRTNPGNVYSLDGSNLPGLDTPFAGIPAGTDGTGLTPADFVETAGKLNRDPSYWGHASQRPPTQQYSALFYGTYQLSPAVELFTEILWTHYEAEEWDYQHEIIGSTGLYRVAASNPFNPFGVDVGIEYRFEGAGRWCFCLEQEYQRWLAGAKGSIGDWNWEVAGSLTKGDDTTDEGPALGLTYEDLEVTNAALADPNPATALNPFADRSDWTLADVIRYGAVKRTQRLQSKLQSIDASVRGPLFDLGAGPVEVLLGAAWERSTLDYNFFITSFDGERENYAVFSEARMPLMAPGTEGGAERLVLTGALRYDDYSDFGSKTSSQLGIEFRPIESLLLRAAYSSAYKPPTLYNLFAPVNTYPAFLITDAQRGGETYGVTILQGGNPDLDPLTGYSTNAGFIFAPTTAPGLELSATHWTAKIDNYATFLNQDLMIANEDLFAEYITRGAPTPEDVANGLPGRIVELRSLILNFGTFDLAGVDMAATWRTSTSLGEVIPSISVSRTYKYETALVPGAPAQNAAGKATSRFFAPKWKGVASLAWNTPRVQTTLTGRYVGQYEDYAPSTRSLGAYWFFDVNLRYAIGRALWPDSPYLEQSYLTVGAVNLFNRLPEYSYYFGTIGYDPTQADIRGRFLYAQFGLKF